MAINRVCVIGGTGFVGRHLCHRLSAAGIACRVLTRHPQRHRQLLLTPGLQLQRANVFDRDSLSGALRDCDAVVNLVGILNASGHASFQRVHVELVERVLQAAVDTGVRRLLHMSALRADATHGSSAYLRSKGAGEDLAHRDGDALGIEVTSFRPSVVFGPDDSFINRFAGLLRLPGPLPLACPDARFAPVYVGDVARAFCHALQQPATIGNRFDLCGPDSYGLEEIVRYIAAQLGMRKAILRLPDWASRVQATLLQFAPGKPFTPDNYLSLQTPSTCDRNHLPELGIDPTPMDAIVPSYLAPRALRGLRGPR